MLCSPLGWGCPGWRREALAGTLSGMPCRVSGGNRGTDAGAGAGCWERSAAILVLDHDALPGQRLAARHFRVLGGRKVSSSRSTVCSTVVLGRVS